MSDALVALPGHIFYRSYAGLFPLKQSNLDHVETPSEIAGSK